MSISTRVWLVLAVAYGAFFYWYTPFGGPLRDDEIAHYTRVIEAAADSPERVAVWVEFMGTDSGNDFVMLNAIDLRETPTPGPGIEPGATSEEVLARYTMPFLGLALRSAAHPVLMGRAAAPAIDIWGIEGAHEWSQGGLVRYRSRRDLLEQVEAIAAADAAGIHDFKIAAIEKTIAYPLDPWFHLGDPRLVLGLVLLVFGLAWQCFSNRSA